MFSLRQKIAFSLQVPVAASSRRALSSISGFKAREVIDSRGNPTVEVCLASDDEVLSDLE